MKSISFLKVISEEVVNFEGDNDRKEIENTIEMNVFIFKENFKLISCQISKLISGSDI